MLSHLTAAVEHVLTILRDENGAIGWLIVGIIIGAIGIVVLIVQLLIPGD